LLAHGRWFSPGTPASPGTKTGRHDIAKILLKVALNTKNQSINQPNAIHQWMGILIYDIQMYQLVIISTIPTLLYCLVNLEGKLM
jgi:hypothetical protein